MINLRQIISNYLYESAEYITGIGTWIFSFVGLNIHLNNYYSTIIVKIISGFISLFFTVLAVVVTHYLKKHLNNKKS